MEPLQGQITTAGAGVAWHTRGLCHSDGGGGNNGGGGGVSKQHGLNFFLGSSASRSVVGEQEEHVNKQAAYRSTTSNARVWSMTASPEIISHTDNCSDTNYGGFALIFFAAWSDHAVKMTQQYNTYKNRILNYASTKCSKLIPNAALAIILQVHLGFSSCKHH